MVSKMIQLECQTRLCFLSFLATFNTSSNSCLPSYG